MTGTLAMVGSDGYDTVLVIHIVSVVVGFGAMSLSAVSGQHSRNRPGVGALAITEANQKVATVASYVVAVVLLSGIGLVSMSDDAWKYDQTWIWLSLALFVVLMAITHGFIRPNTRRMIGLQGELVAMMAGGPPAGGPPAGGPPAGGPPAGGPPGGRPGGPPPQVAQMQALAKRGAMAGATSGILVIVIISLMVFKPGL